MATLILENGTRRTVEPADRSRGFTLAECYALLDCTMIEMVRTQRGPRRSPHELPSDRPLRA